MCARSCKDMRQDDFARNNANKISRIMYMRCTSFRRHCSRLTALAHLKILFYASVVVLRGKNRWIGFRHLHLYSPSGGHIKVYILLPVQWRPHSFTDMRSFNIALIFGSRSKDLFILHAHGQKSKIARGAHAFLKYSNTYVHVTRWNSSGRLDIHATKHKYYNTSPIRIPFAGSATQIRTEFYINIFYVFN